MTNEKAVEILSRRDFHCSSCANSLTGDCGDCILNSALNIAVHAIETGDVYMSAEDYNVFLEGYRQGLADMGYRKGEK